MELGDMLVGIWLLIFVILSLLWLILWILTIVHQAKKRRFVWMVFTILFQITVVIYWFVWVISPKFRKKKNG